MYHKDSFEKEQLKLKRFDDIFRMMLLVITIMISTGSLSSEFDLNLWSTFVFVFFSLSLWMLGHAIGSNEYLRDMEAVTKLNAWAFAIFAGVIVAIKFVFSSSFLNYELSGLSGLFAMILTIPPYYYLSKGIPDLTRKRFIKWLGYTFFSILVMVQLGVIL